MGWFADRGPPTKRSSARSQDLQSGDQIAKGDDLLVSLVQREFLLRLDYDPLPIGNARPRATKTLIRYKAMGE